MKKCKVKKTTGLVVMIIMTCVYPFSSDADDRPYGYVGKWVMKNRVELNTPSGTITNCIQLTFAKSYLTVLMSENKDMEPINNGIRGPIEVDGSIITFKLNEKWNSHNSEWESHEVWLRPKHSTYSVSGNTLTLTKPNGETSEYTKQ